MVPFVKWIVKGEMRILLSIFATPAFVGGLVSPLEPQIAGTVPATLWAGGAVQQAPTNLWQRLDTTFTNRCCRTASGRKHTASETSDSTKSAARLIH